MRILSVILLLLTTYIPVDSRFVPSNKVLTQKAPEIISDDFGEENRQLDYNKSASLVRKKRDAALIVAVITTIVSTYGCNALAQATPLDSSLKRWALKFWGFREGQEASRWKELAKFVYRNVSVDADGNITEIRDFVDAPPGLENQVERFRMEATLTVTKILEDEAEQEEIMRQEHEKNREQGIHTPEFLSKVRKSEDLDQMTKAMMADNMIYTLISKNGVGETTWKVNHKKQEHRDIYEALLRIKAAIDKKYKDQCQLRRITAKELPELKAWYVRLLGAVPEWFSNVFKGVKAAKHKQIKKNEEFARKIDEIHAMAEEVLKNAQEVARKAIEENQEKMKHDAEFEPLKNLSVLVKVLPTKDEVLKEKEVDNKAKLGQSKPKEGVGLFPTPAQLLNKIHPVVKGHHKKEDTHYPLMNVPIHFD